ncbi:membrane protein insertase YidC [Sulfitobacter sp. BSw21498]|uniref:membrane protein insertase YidC n=1 Tax=Sulfitobacter sp. BSw21498 TaxID=664426 RepID=UPI0011109404|nr:membrane protein insertase YidC [Sulfitobacter sp. BSw21498]
MDDQNKNLIFATVLSFIVILGWFVLFPPQETETLSEPPLQTSDANASEAVVPANAGSASIPAEDSASTTKALDTAPRIAVETARIAGSISLLGGRVDDLYLKDYNTTIEEDAPTVRLLSPAGSTDAYYALYGWAPGAGISPEQVPGPNTLWSHSDGETLSVDAPVTLTWDNKAGQVFSRTISIDENYMFKIDQTITNSSEKSVSLAPYGLIARHGIPSDAQNFFILHEGLVTMNNGELIETAWDDIPDLDVVNGVPSKRIDGVTNGWIGFTGHYFMTNLIPDPAQPTRLTVKYLPRTEIFQTEAVMPAQVVGSGQSATVSTQLFAGAKEWEILRAYEAQGVYKFIDSIDWGWFFFLTKPIFWVLHHLNLLIGNMGIAIIGLTLLIKALLFPLAYKSYVSMAKMKELQPQMEKLKKDAGDDRQKLQQGMMELYKREKVNPAAGCLPILMQIPIFFSLYKVIFVTLELRHAPFFGPFQDLSAPDPTSIYNLYGLLPWGAPEAGTVLALVFIGILPLLLGISMFLQQKLNPAPTDPTQQMIFAWMPWVFMFMLGGFASGLVVYWIANNTITFTQQYLIMRSQGYKPDILGNIKGSMKVGRKGDPK